jgi:Tfp pilus assembly protein PilN
MKYFRSLPLQEGSLSSLVKRELMAVERMVGEGVAGRLSLMVVDGAEEGEREALEAGLPLKVHFASAPEGEAALEEGVDARDVSSARGLAEAAAEGGELLDLLPSGFREERKRRSPLSSLHVLLVLAFLALGFWFGRAYSEREKLAAVERQIEALRDEVMQVEELKSQVDAYLAKLSTFEDLRLKEPGKLDILRELTVIIPPTAWFSVLIYEDGKLDIRGYAESASGLIPILEESEYFTNAQFIASIVQRPWGEEFKIRADVEK